MSNGIVIAAFYKFAALPDYMALRGELATLCRGLGNRGTLLLAEEGINGTLSGTREGIDTLLDRLRADERLADLVVKEATAPDHPFYRLKVRLKREIVSMGVPGIDPNHEVGTYVEPEDWNELIADPELLLVDTRNHYEVDIGTFEGALDPHVDTFRDFPRYVDEHLHPETNPKIAMFCTGGIRCEKATAYLLKQGFRHVYHLQGGILNYLQKVDPAESRWNGECFVFDNRVSVDERLAPGHHRLCFGCRMPLHPEDLKLPQYEEGVSCPRCHGTHSAEKLEGLRERQRQTHLARERRQVHIGDPD